ncbi:MAG: ribokinase [Brevirhabdus sp.]
MTIYNLGSINADHFYRVPHVPAPGETIAATSRSTGLGGKGANQSVAAARMGSRVVHIGAVGPDGDWAVDRLRGYGVDTDHIASVDTPTAHANITVGEDGENAIVIFPGANVQQELARITTALAGAAAGDTLMLQNETNAQVDAARIAREKGLRVVYSAAPFSVDAVRAVLPFVTLLVMNEVEAQQLAQALGDAAEAVPEVLVTKGAKGAEWHEPKTKDTVFQPSFPVTPVDTTGAGDTFAGSFVAGLDQGMSVAHALELASGAAALKVTRHGTADAIPSRAETVSFIKKNA